MHRQLHRLPPVTSTDRANAVRASVGWSDGDLVPAVQQQVYPAGTAQADEDIGRACARVPSGQRDGSAYFVLGTGPHGEVAAAGTTSEAVAAKVVPVDVDALARDCPDLRGDTGRVVDVSLDGAR